MLYLIVGQNMLLDEATTRYSLVVVRIKIVLQQECISLALNEPLAPGNGTLRLPEWSEDIWCGVDKIESLGNDGGTLLLNVRWVVDGHF